VQTEHVISTSALRYVNYTVRYSVVPINSSPLTIKLFSSVLKTPVHNDTKYSVSFMTLEPSLIVLQYFCG